MEVIKREKHISKDAILKQLAAQPTLQDSISSMATILNLDFYHSISVCDEIITDQYVDHIPDYPPLSNHDKKLKISPRGINFIVNEGGYTEKQRLAEIENRNAARESWPKRNWFWADFFKIVIGGIVGALITYYATKIQKPSTTPTSTSSKDSSLMRK